MLIRKIVEEDNSVMADIIRNSLLEFNAAKPGTVYFDESTDHLSELFNAKRSAYFVLEIHHEIAGGGGYFPTKGLPKNNCELVKMYVSKKFRGKGLGKILLQKCMEEAKKEGYKKMYLESMPELVNAIAMYAKNGFSYIPQPLGNSGHTGCDVWMMRDL
ncbi:MAG TPA: GNAT family N-acetyltransferase [Hanamia sp.]